MQHVCKQAKLMMTKKEECDGGLHVRMQQRGVVDHLPPHVFMVLGNLGPLNELYRALQVALPQSL